MGHWWPQQFYSKLKCPGGRAPGDKLILLVYQQSPLQGTTGITAWRQPQSRHTGKGHPKSSTQQHNAHGAHPAGITHPPTGAGFCLAAPYLVPGVVVVGGLVDLHVPIHELCRCQPRLLRQQLLLIRLLRAAREGHCLVLALGNAGPA